MTDEQKMRDAMQRYIDTFNTRKLAELVSLYSVDASIEDPVGSPLKQGREAIRAFYEMAFQTGAKLSLAAPIRASHGNASAMAFDVALTLPEGDKLIQVIDVMTFNDAGEFTSMKAYWGPGDVHSAAAPHPAHP